VILDQLKLKQIEYMKAKDDKRLGVLRLFLSQVKYKEIELRPQHQEMTDEAAFKVIKKMIKQKNEAIELCKQANRQDAVDAETAELELLKEIINVFPAEWQIEEVHGRPQS
jgi:uncharacterized protein